MPSKGTLEWIEMRALFSIFIILLFAGNQALAGSCGSMCIHSDGSHKNHSQVDSQPSDHSCCDTSKKEDTDERDHDCSLGLCMVSMPSIGTPLASVDVQTEKKLVDSAHAIKVANLFRLASLSSNALLLDQSDPNGLSLPVPLYIYYQKLLLP